MSSLLTENTYAARKHGYRTVVVSQPVVHHGKTYRKLPVGYKTVRVKRDRYYYHVGAFYRRGPSGYVYVRAPIGAIVVGLPVGYRSLWVGGISYYYYNDVFYRRVPSGYMVVEAPSEIKVVKEISAIIQPSVYTRGEVFVTSYSLNIRSGPGLDFPVIDQVYRDDSLEIHGKTDGWLYVKLPNGQFGWVMKTYTFEKYPPASG
jgi:hypothetical protein